MRKSILFSALAISLSIFNVHASLYKCNGTEDEPVVDDRVQKTYKIDYSFTQPYIPDDGYGPYYSHLEDNRAPFLSTFATASLDL